MRGWFTLNSLEQEIAIMQANRIYEQNRKEGIIDRKIGPQKAMVSELNSRGAELAACKYLNIYPDLSVSVRKGGPDAYWKDGRKIDIKNTPYGEGHLIATLTTDPKNELYVLMIGSFPTYRYAGYCYSDMLLREESIKDFGYGPTYALPQLTLLDEGRKLV